MAQDAANCLIKNTAKEEGYPGVTGSSKERRASLVIKDTQELLVGLHAQADSSNMLIAELEALLAASQAASREAPKCSDGASRSSTRTMVMPHFVAVEPLRPLSPDVEDYAHEEEPPLPSSTLMASRRRSSVITFDGSTLFGGSGTAAPHQHGPASACSDASTFFAPARARSFTRGHRGLVGRSWTEGRPDARLAVSQRVSGDNVSVCGPAAHAGLPSRSGKRAGQATAAHMPYDTAGAGPQSGNSLSSGAVPGIAWATVPGGAASPFLVQGGLAEDDEEELWDAEAEDLRDASAASGAGGGGGSGSGEQAGRPASRAPSRRFMRMLKGMFNTREGGTTATATTATAASRAPRTHTGFVTPQVPPPSLQPLSVTNSFSTSHRNLTPSRSLGAGAPAPAPTTDAPAGGRPEAQRPGGAWGGLTPSPRSCSLTTGGGRPLAPTQHPLRGTSFQVPSAIATAASSPAAGAPPPAAAGSAATVRARSLSAAQSFVDGQQQAGAAVGMHHAGAQQALQADGKAAAAVSLALGSRASMRRSLECMFPQI